MNKYKYVKTNKTSSISNSTLSFQTQASSVTPAPQPSIHTSKYIKQSALDNLQQFQHSSFTKSYHSKFKISNSTQFKINNATKTSTTSTFNNKYIKAECPRPIYIRAKPTPISLRPDPAKYKVTNYASIHPKKTPRGPAASAAILKLLAIRRSKFIRTNTLSHVANNRYKLIKQKSSVNAVRLNRLNLSKYKLNNTSNARESCLNNKYIRYSRGITAGSMQSKQHLANNLVHKSIMTINRHHQLSSAKKHPLSTSHSTSVSSKPSSMTYCLFFNRFGRCSRGNQCSKIHDPKRIALCPRFLRGTCNQQNSCPFSHEISAEKMPLCSHYAKGCCSRENCPYSHVYCGKDAEICLRFARDGFCALGVKCDRAHLSECVEYVREGRCSKGEECPFIHRGDKTWRNKKAATRRKSSVGDKVKC